jgi:uncharacterized membrane protein YgcG
MRASTKRRLKRVLLTAVVMMPLALTAQAQAPGDGQRIAEIIDANQGRPARICPACTPALMADPARVSEVLAYAAANPAMRTILAQCLARLQTYFKAADPEAAEIVQAQILGSSSGFQAEYAIAFANNPGPFGGVTAGGAGAGNNFASFGGGGGGAGGGGGGNGNGNGNGGGPIGGGGVSPAAPPFGGR